jgi:hypothetical protein
MISEPLEIVVIGKVSEIPADDAQALPGGGQSAADRQSQQVSQPPTPKGVGECEDGYPEQDP